MESPINQNEKKEQKQVQATLRINKELIEVYVKHNTAGKTYEQFEKDMSRDYYMTATEAINYGLADSIVTKK